MLFEPKLTDKKWDIKNEKNIFRLWQEKKVFRFNMNTKAEIFSIDTPPPYPSGRPWHIGAAAHYSQIDMIARTARMLGFETYFPIGIDRNGIPVERYTEKLYGIKLQDTPREKFIELCKTSLDDLEAEMIQIMKNMGLSGDFDNYYRTDSIEYRTLTQSTFIELWKKGLIYEATRPNNFCYDCGTTIADADVVYKDLPTQLVYIKFKIKGSEESIVIATTRPELLCSCQAVIANPRDERYKKFFNKKAIIPIYQREVPIIPHSSADPNFGSGLAMICSYGDLTDVRLFRELKLDEIIAINTQGRLTEVAGKYAGLKVEDARKAIIEDLEKEKLVVKKENIVHHTPVCERSNVPIEIIPMKEFYLDQLNFIPILKKIQKKIKFHPEKHRQRLIDWMNSLTIDWPISRRRYYGTEIPIWYCENCNEPHLPKSGRYYQPWRQKAPFKKCKKCGNKTFIGETRTFDTWFDSSISPLFISKFMKDKRFFTKFFPTSLRPQGKDIVRTWLYYTLLRCYQLTKKIPWEHAWIMGYGVDEKGEKMSKSKGNVIDPFPIIEKYGADAFRFWSAQEASLGEDFRCSEERIKNSGKFLTKLWNLARFISMFPQPKKAKLLPSDKWILAELNKTIAEALKGYENFNFFIPATKMREFTWNVFADHYIEMIKPRAYGDRFNKAEQQAAWFTLHTCLKNILVILAPIIPFITEYIWQALYSKKSLHLQKFPTKIKRSKNFERLTPKIIEFNSKVWSLKKKMRLTLKDSIEAKIPKELKIFEKDLRAMHNIKP
ncbi:MAG: valine--tRNA ligase [Candidatus Aenigmatarchaeota archaeon]